LVFDGNPAKRGAGREHLPESDAETLKKVSLGGLKDTLIHHALEVVEVAICVGERTPYRSASMD
jgi:hypothetical protein